MRSATPQLSRNVAEDTGPAVQKIRAKAIISIRPSLITAAFVLSPKPRPSQKPAPTATMFLRDERGEKCQLRLQMQELKTPGFLKNTDHLEDDNRIQILQN